jgi:predicted metal-dependent hydrolase
MLSNSVMYGSQSIDFSIQHVSRNTLAIEVLPDSSVVIKAPIGTGVDDIRKKVAKRARWIIRQQQYFRQFEPRTPERQYVGGETHLYLGRQFRIRVYAGSKNAVKLSRGYFHIELLQQSETDAIRKLLMQWYAEKAKSKFIEVFERCWPIFEKLGHTQPRIQIRIMKKRWGSLSRNGLLTINTDLIRAPKECIDYVITHELCHLQYHDHGPEFYRLLEKVMPDWEKRKHKLELALV